MRARIILSVFELFSMKLCYCLGCVGYVRVYLYLCVYPHYAGLDEAQDGQSAGRNINKLRYADETLPLWQRAKKNSKAS